MIIASLRKMDQGLDRWRRWVRGRLGIGRNAPVSAVAYGGFGRSDFVFLQGRVLKEKFIISKVGDSGWRNFLNSLKRFESDEVPNAKLRVTIGDHHFHLVSDQEGYFRLDTPLDPPISTSPSGWFTARIHLYELPWRRADVLTHTQVLVPGQRAQFGIISDIDDTILHTGLAAPLKLKALYNTMLKNATSRTAFHEVAAFYRALQEGPDQMANNPFFYVSNSPWNLFDLVEDFLELNELPRGPILQRDIGIPQDNRPTDYQGHKYWSISRILETYPHLHFVLIGDSGESDAQIYLRVAKAFPGRIKAIYIHDVRHRKKARKIAQLIHKSTGLEMHLFRSYREAAANAHAYKLLRQSRFEQLAD